MPYRRKDSPVWWISYADASGQRFRESSGSTNRKEAAALEGKRKLEAHRQSKWDVAPKRLYDEVMLAYLSDTATTKKSHSRDLTSAKALQAHFTGKAIDDLTAQDITDYKRLRREAGRKEATIAKELLLLSAAINYARAEWGWEIKNPVTGRVPVATRKAPRWFTHDEARALLTAAIEIKVGRHFLDFVELGLATGMRTGEMLGMTWERVHFDQRMVLLDVGDQKAKRFDSVPLNETALAVLRRRLLVRQKHCPRSEWVFCHQDGSRIKSVKKAFRSACKAAKLKRASPHSLRHTFASWLVMAGVPLRTVADLCRHKDIRTTMIYAHLSPEHSRPAIGLIDDIFKRDQIVTDSSRSQSKSVTYSHVGHKIAA